VGPACLAGPAAGLARLACPAGLACPTGPAGPALQAADFPDFGVFYLARRGALATEICKKHKLLLVKMEFGVFDFATLQKNRFFKKM